VKWLFYLGCDVPRCTSSSPPVLCSALFFCPTLYESLDFLTQHLTPFSHSGLFHCSRPLYCRQSDPLLTLLSFLGESPQLRPRFAATAKVVFRVSVPRSFPRPFSGLLTCCCSSSPFIPQNLHAAVRIHPPPPSDRPSRFSAFSNHPSHIGIMAMICMLGPSKDGCLYDQLFPCRRDAPQGRLSFPPLVLSEIRCVAVANEDALSVSFRVLPRRPHFFSPYPPMAGIFSSCAQSHLFVWSTLWFRIFFS